MYGEVRSTIVRGRPVDIGIYLNPDDIAKQLKVDGELDLLENFGLMQSKGSLMRFALRSGLLKAGFDVAAIRSGHWFRGSTFVLRNTQLADRFAQLLTAFLCDQLIRRRKKFSFETVFSHPSKVDLMELAKARGYKVYLYFIATNSAEINKDRVKIRVANGGHDVPDHLVEKRYRLALKNLVPAIRHCYHAFFFDNSGAESLVFAEFKETPIGWDWSRDLAKMPDWFIQHYLLATGDPSDLMTAREAMAFRK